MQHHQFFLSVFKAISIMCIQSLGRMTLESTFSQSTFSFPWEGGGGGGEGQAEKFHIRVMPTLENF